MQGKQCPKCLYHAHETFFAEKNRKRWAIDRCAHCHYGFDIEPYEGSLFYFDQQVDKQRDKSNETKP